MTRYSKSPFEDLIGLYTSARRLNDFHQNVVIIYSTRNVQDIEHEILKETFKGSNWDNWDYDPTEERYWRQLDFEILCETE